MILPKHPLIRYPLLSSYPHLCPFPILALGSLIKINFQTVLYPGLSTTQKQMTDPIIQMTLQNIQAQHHMMQLMLSRFGNNETVPPTEGVRVNLEYPKWDSNFAFGVFGSQVGKFTANTFPSL